METDKVCVGRIIDFHVHEHQAHLNWFCHSDTCPASLRACIPIVPHPEQIIQVPEVVQTLESEWIPEDKIMSLAFMFHNEAIKAGEVDCCGVELAWFIRFCADEVTSAVEWLPWEHHHPFSDSLGIGSEDSYPRRIWSGIVSVQNVTRKLLWNVKQSQLLKGASVNIPLAQEVWTFFMQMLPLAKGMLMVPKCVVVYHPSLMVENQPTIYCIEYA